MKKTTIYGFLALALSAGVVACNNDGDSASSGTSETDTTTSTTSATAPDHTATTTATSTNNYAALADTFNTNSKAGNYLDARTGKPIKIRVDTATGMRLNDATNQPVWRYVDKRDYKVYGGDDNNSMWDTVGTARMQNDRLEYMGENNQWVNYDKQWKIKDDKLNNDWKMKSGDTKIKVSKDGDVKIKDENGKVKYDADDNKVKVKEDKKSDKENEQ
jgi:hypothetical protein